jgi:hypothetical protein
MILGRSFLEDLLGDADKAWDATRLMSFGAKIWNKGFFWFPWDQLDDNQKWLFYFVLNYKEYK